MPRKSYNPFKMWGSYVGALIGFLVTYFKIGMPFLRLGSLVGCGRPGGFGDIAPTVCVPFYTPTAYILFIALGFLIGWGIHSLVRALK